MITLFAQSKCYGNSHQYIARITGRAAKYTYAREFVGRKSDRSTEALIDEPGIYEIVDIDKKGRKDPGFCLILPRPAHCPPKSDTADPALMNFSISEEDVMTITKRLDQGEMLGDIIACETDAEGKYRYGLRTKGAAKKASLAVTLDAAVEHCWQVLQALPEREAKKVLAALKSRISPKPVAVSEPTPTEPTPVLCGGASK